MKKDHWYPVTSGNKRMEKDQWFFEFVLEGGLDG